jgi:hypothetical protein
MELSSLNERQLDALQPLVALFNRIRPDTSRGHVLPIGQEPSGTSWTGLQCMLTETEGYVLVFREKNDEPSGSFKLWGHRSDSIRLTCLARSSGPEQQAYPADEQLEPAPASDGTIRLSLDQPFSFALYRYSL